MEIIRSSGKNGKNVRKQPCFTEPNLFRNAENTIFVEIFSMNIYNRYKSNRMAQNQKNITFLKYIKIIHANWLLKYLKNYKVTFVQKTL